MRKKYPTVKWLKRPSNRPFAGSLGSPITGSKQLTAAQVAQLRGGFWYVNLHTAAFPGGEIRGQVTAAR